MFATLRQYHPRLFLSDERLIMLNKRAGEDVFLALLIDNLRRYGDTLIDQEATTFQIIGPRMLKNCQQIRNRVMILSLLYRLTLETKYKDRVMRELEAAASFPHWNPDHFLDTAELCTAFAIAYDWLFHWLSPSELSLLRDALVEKGLKKGVQQYQENGWWLSHRFNWNNVCHGGLLIGGLALADEEPDLARTFLSMTMDKLPISLANYRPDGAWQAGPEYWEYTTWYTALVIDALITALGHDGDLMKSPGLEKTGDFRVHCQSPTGKVFNFADSDEQAQATPVLFWLGDHYKQFRLIHENHRQLLRQLNSASPIHPFHIVWYQPDEQIAHEPPKRSYFRGAEVVFMRSSFSDDDALFIGFKGGLNQADHGHLDLGSFVLDAQGIRWLVDLGRDHYDLPGYWDNREGGRRWAIYRLNNLSHNTLTINDDLQRADAQASIVKTRFSENNSFAIADLTAAFHPHVKEAKRGVALVDGEVVIVQDEIVWATRNRKVEWRVITDAEIVLEGSRTILQKNGRQMTAQILSPPRSHFEVGSIHRLPPENSNADFQQLTFSHVETGEKTILCVILSASGAERALVNLRDW